MDIDALTIAIKNGSDKGGVLMLDLYEQTKGLLFYLINGSTPEQDKEDLQQEFFLWLCDAIDKFDPTQGTKFASFLTARLKGNIKTYYYEHKQTVYCPRNRLAYLKSYEEQKRRLSDIIGREPSEKQICSFMGIKAAELKQIKKDLAALSAAKSLDEENETGATLADAIPDKTDFAEDLTEELAREKAYKPLFATVSKESGIDEQIIKEFYSVEYRGKYDAIKPQLTKAIQKIKHTPAKYGALQRALEYQDINCNRYKGVAAFQNTSSSIVEDIVFKNMERREIMIEYATKNLLNGTSTEAKKENICSICGKKGAERRILSEAQAIEYAIRGNKDARNLNGTILICDKCLAKKTRQNKFLCEVKENKQVIEYR